MIRESRGGLEGSRCRVCGRAACPPQIRHCGVPTDPVTLRASGTIESWSIARVAPERFGPPYAFAYVRLADGPRVFARLEDWSEGEPVEMGEAVVLARGPIGRARDGAEGPVARRVRRGREAGA